jgi:hypothetical protein
MNLPLLVENLLFFQKTVTELGSLFTPHPALSRKGRGEVFKNKKGVSPD